MHFSTADVALGIAWCVINMTNAYRSTAPRSATTSEVISIRLP